MNDRFQITFVIAVPKAKVNHFITFGGKNVRGERKFRKKEMKKENEKEMKSRAEEKRKKQRKEMHMVKSKSKM